MTDGDGIAIGILMVLRQQARYPYVKEKLGRVIDYLKTREIPEVRQEGPLLFVDAFDHYLGDAIDKRWEEGINWGDAPHA